MPDVRKKEPKIRNIAKIDVMAPAKLHPLPKNEKTRWKIFAQRKNTAQKNTREISGVNALGVDITGQYLDKLPSIEEIVKPRYDWLVKHKRPYYIADQVKWSKKTFIRVRTLGLPLSSNGKGVDIIMFVLHYVL